MQLHRLIFLALTLWAAPSHAQDQDIIYGSGADFLASIPFSKPGDSLVASGDLTDDGLNDLAVIVLSGQEGVHSQLFVLNKDKTGNFSVVQQTSEYPVAGTGCCWVEAMQIRRGSLYIQNNAKTACSMEAATHQFKLYSGTWKLIGVKVVRSEQCGSEEVVIRDTNVLTGKTIHSHQMGDKPVRTWVTQDKPRALTLQNYDFSNSYGAPLK